MKSSHKIIILVAVIILSIGIFYKAPLARLLGFGGTEFEIANAALHAACKKKNLSSSISVFHNGVLWKEFDIDDFESKYAKQKTSIPYNKKERGRMYPVSEWFELLPGSNSLELTTCAKNRKIKFTKRAFLEREDPVYWMRKRKGFISTFSMKYNSETDTSTKEKFKARPILAFNLSH